MWSLTVIAAFVAAVFAIEHYLRNRRYYQLGKALPGPRPLPLVGNGLLFLGDASHDLLAILKKVATDKHFTAVWFGLKLVIFVTSPELAQKILTNRDMLNNSDEVRFLEPFLGKGVSTVNGDEWKEVRKLVVPTFKLNYLRNYLSVFEKQSRILVQQLQKEVGKTEFDILPYLSRCTFDILWETTIGEEIKSQQHKVTHLDTLSEICDLTYARIVKFWQRSDFLYKIFFQGRKYDAAVKSFLSFVEERMKKKLEESETSDDGVEFERKIFIDGILKGRQLNFEQLRDHAMNLILAYLNLGNASGFVMLMLAIHPEVQEKAYQEGQKVHEALENRALSAEDVEKLEYIDMVIKETLRLFPVFSFSTRHVNDDLQWGDHVIPKGATLAINFSQIHRDPDSYPEPDKFNPDNFLRENISKRHPYSFIPLGGGLRNCVASKYTMWAIKVVVYEILLKFKLQCDYKLEDVHLMSKLSLGVKNGFCVRIVNRE